MILPDGHPGASLAAEKAGINLYSEYSLHDQVKRFLADAGDRLEASVAGRVVDLLKADGSVVEVQTRNLAALVPKVRALSESGRAVCVVHPVPVTRRIVRKDPDTGREVSVRRSPKRGDSWSVFDELVKASSLIALPRVSVEALLVRVTEIRVRDGSGSWRRRGDRTEDRLLDAVEGRVRWETPEDWLSLIPRDLPPPWSSESLGLALGLPAPRARKVLYCLARAGLILEAGREGRRKIYDRPCPTESA
jgi:hypothetical protein